jgi:hypothetical protein
MTKKTKTDPKSDIIRIYTKLAEKHHSHPSRAAMYAAGVTRERIRHHFVSLTKLHDIAKVTFPDVFASINATNVHSPERMKALDEALAGSTRFVITTAVTGQKIHKGFLAALRNYCKVNNAKLLILTSTDPASNRDEVPYDPELEKEHIVSCDVSLNKNIFLSAIKLSAKQIDPLTGLDRLCQGRGSFIFASPKQRMKILPTGNSSLPCALMTTGACTLPSYDPNPEWPHAYHSKRTAEISLFDHRIGCIFVELDGPKKFHFRQAQADKQGRFIDLGKMYSADSVEDAEVSALILGDWHSGCTDPEARALFVESDDSVTALVKPKEVILHDLFNATSISHHMLNNRTLRAQLSKTNSLSLEKELKGVALDLEMFAKYFDNITVVRSNHDEALDRWLKDGSYVDDAQNLELGAKLAVAAIQGLNPLEWAMTQYLPKEVLEKIYFLGIDEDYKIANVTVSAHGHLGSNGSRGSLKNIEGSYTNVICGHSHTAQILRDAWQVGTSSNLKLEYNKGPSSWIRSSCLLNRNGSRQLINIIDGKWRA